MIYLKYLKSLLLHKWYVFQAGIKLGVPIWRLIVHDWSKFLPVEFIPYARNFFGDYPDESDLSDNLVHLWAGTKTKQQIRRGFDRAWLHHQNTNPHHWQYWILVYDDDPEKVKALLMPDTYVREMLADWMGAGRAYTGSWNMAEWLSKNGPKTILHNDTLLEVHAILEDELGYVFTNNGLWVCLWTENL